MRAAAAANVQQQQWQQSNGSNRAGAAAQTGGGGGSGSSTSSKRATAAAPSAVWRQQLLGGSIRQARAGSPAQQETCCSCGRKITCRLSLAATVAAAAAHTDLLPNAGTLKIDVFSSKAIRCHINVFFPKRGLLHSISLSL
jgi:hypothetical protein